MMKKTVRKKTTRAKSTRAKSSSSTRMSRGNGTRSTMRMGRDEGRMENRWGA
jgi:hypothetical protein